LTTSGIYETQMHTHTTQLVLSMHAIIKTYVADAIACNIRRAPSAKMPPLYVDSEPFSFDLRLALRLSMKTSEKNVFGWNWYIFGENSSSDLQHSVIKQNLSKLVQNSVTYGSEFAIVQHRPNTAT